MHFLKQKQISFFLPVGKFHLSRMKRPLFLSFFRFNILIYPKQCETYIFSTKSFQNSYNRAHLKTKNVFTCNPLVPCPSHIPSICQYPAMLPSATAQGTFKMIRLWDTWVVQLVERPTSAWVMISWFVNSNLALGSVLTVWILLLILCLPLSLPLPCMCSVSLSKINIKKIKK